MNESDLNDLHVNESEVLNNVVDNHKSNSNDNLENDRFKKGEGYHAVPPPYTRNYMPPRADLSFTGLDNSVFKSKLSDYYYCSLNKVWTSTVNAAKQSSHRAATSVSAANRVNTAASRPNVNNALPTTYSYFKEHSLVRRPFNQKTAAKTNNFNEKVNTAKVNNVTTAGPKVVVSAVEGNRNNGNPQYALQGQGIFDSGCSIHMTGNKSYLTDYQDIYGGFVAFGGNAKRGKIIGKGKIRTGKLDFEDVYFVKELKFNLFSVSQMCDNKNSVLFTHTECVVLSLDFKLLDESQVLLKVPRNNNVYSFDLKNVVPVGGDETPETLKNFIASIENQMDHKVKTIRCDNRTEFKNRIMNEFCEIKGIRREFSVATTPQQNGVAERKNRALIEAARIMLADFKFPTTFWAKAVNIACYVQNRVLVIKPHNKTPYELFLGPKSLENEVADDARKKSTKVPRKENGVQDPVKEGDNNDQDKDLRDQEKAFRKQCKQEFERLFDQGKTANTNSTNRLNTISLLANADDNGNMMFTFVSAAGSTYVNLGGSILVNAAILPNPDLPTDPLMPDLEDTKVWRLVDLPKGKHVIGTKWVFKNGKDERGIVVKNKMDVKSDFLYGTIEEEVYVCQPIGFEDPHFPNKVYKVEKALYCLHQAPRACQDKYVADILKKFDFSSVKTASTPIDTSKAFLNDEDAKDVDVHLYRSMIGSLMYLIASRPNIMLVVCACARFKVTLKVSHLHAVKRIFRYLKDSDYARTSLDRISTTRGCQFLEKRLISWQCKKKTVVTNSKTDAEYVAAANCYGQVLWIQNQMLDYGFNFMNTKIYIDNESTICIVKNPVYPLKTKHIETSHHFIRDSYEKRLIQIIKIHTDHNVADLLTKAFDVSSLDMALVMNLELKLVVAKIIDFFNASYVKYALTVNPTVYTSCIEQFLATAKVKKVIITETSIKRDLRFEDEGGVNCLSNEVIFEQLTLMGSTMASAIIYLATNKKFNFSKYIFDNMVKHLDGGVKFLMYLRFVQVYLDNQVEEGKDFYGNVTPLFETMMVQALEDMGKDDFMYQLIKKVLDLEEAKIAQAKEIARLKKRVKKLEQKRKSRTLWIKRLRKGRMNEEDMFGVNDLHGDEVVVDVLASEKLKQSVKVVEKEVSTADPVTTAGELVTTASIEVATANTTLQISKDELTLAQTLIEIKVAKPKAITTVATTVAAAGTRPKAKLIVILQEEKREELSIEEKSRLFVELMGKRKKHFSRLRVEKNINKPPTKAQKKNQMCTYLKSMVNYKHNQLKNKSFKEIQILFNNTMKWIEAFVPKDTKKTGEGSDKAVEGSKKLEEGSSKRVADNLEQENAKRQRIKEENEYAELKRFLEIIHEDDDDVKIEATSLSSKSLTIVDYKIYKEGKKREDLEVLWSIVKARFKKRSELMT
nr:putative ribonuclease H-like domain-containing protein [Tanacetum cinerariifolium]